MSALPANRTAAIAAGSTAVVAGVVIPILGAVPTDWRGPTIIAAILCLTVLGSVFLIGSQKHEARQAQLENDVLSSTLDDTDDAPDPVNERADVPEGEHL